MALTAAGGLIAQALGSHKLPAMHSQRGSQLVERPARAQRPLAKRWTGRRRPL